MELKYRGITYQTVNSSQKVGSLAPLELKYRGITYQTADSRAELVPWPQWH